MTSDLIGDPRVGKNGLPLRSARLISTEITKLDTELKDTKNKIDTVLVMQMGQFIDHDITHAPQFASMDCCGKDRTQRDKCFPLNIPRNDPKWKDKGECMSFTRSLRSADLKCSLDTNIQQVSLTENHDFIFNVLCT